VKFNQVNQQWACMWSSRVSGQWLLSCCQAQYEFFYCKWHTGTVQIYRWGIFVAFCRFHLSQVPGCEGLMPASNEVVYLKKASWPSWRPLDISGTQWPLCCGRQLVNTYFIVSILTHQSNLRTVSGGVHTWQLHLLQFFHLKWPFGMEAMTCQKVVKN